MFAKKPRPASSLDNEIERATLRLATMAPDQEDYGTTVEQIVKLHALKDTPSRIDRNTLVTAGANLLGILAIVEFERIGVLTSKAVGFVPKLFR